MVDFTVHVQFLPAFQYPASNRALSISWELSRRFQKHLHKSRKSANLDSLEAKIPPGRWTSGLRCPPLRHWGGSLRLSQDTAQWEHRLVAISQRTLSCDGSLISGAFNRLPFRQALPALAARGRVPHKSFAASESQCPLSPLGPDSGSGMDAVHWLGDNRPISCHTQCDSTTW